MPRGPRPVLPEMPHHIIHRGHNKQPIFFNERDYERFLTTIKEGKIEFGCKVYSYILMSNHVHMIVEPKDENALGRMMKLVAGRYTRYINKVYKRSGTIWEGRFRSSPIEGERYFLACSRYIEMNPVRAGVAVHPSDYKWSSYRFRALGEQNGFLDLELDPWYESLGDSQAQRQLQYRMWFEESFPESEWKMIRMAVNRGGLTGSNEFGNKVAGILGRRIELRPQGRPPDIIRKNKSVPFKRIFLRDV